MGRKIFCWILAAVLAGTSVHAAEQEKRDIFIPDETLIVDDVQMQMPVGTPTVNGIQEPDGILTVEGTQTPGGMLPVEDTQTSGGQLILEDIQEEPEGSVFLGIDTLHIYENMDSSYSQGYIPRVEDGVVHLVVPFLASGPLKRDCLTVELDMGENAPFVYANYRKEVIKEEYRFDDATESVGVYLFRCDIALESDRKNGKYPVTVKAVGYSEMGRRAELASRIFITVTDGTDSGSGQTDPVEPGTENPPGQTDPTESETEGPPLIVPDGPGGNGGSGGADDGNGGQDGEQSGNQNESQSGEQSGNQNGETNPGGTGSGESDTEEPGTEEPLTEEPGTEESVTGESDTEQSLPDDFGGGGYSGGGYAGGGEIGGSAEKIHRQPKFLLISDSLDGEQLTAGQEYEFTTVFQNMTGDEPVYNMKVTLKTDSEAVDLGCSSFYFGKVRTQETVSLPTCLSVKPNAQAGKVVVAFTFEYENDQGSAYTAAEEVELDIYQPSQVVLEGFRLAPQLYSTDTVDGSFAVHNAGKAAVYNVKVDFAGQGLFSTESVFVGNLEAGTSYEGELRIYVGNKTMKSLGDTGASGENASDNEEAGSAGSAGEDTGAEDNSFGSAGSAIEGQSSAADANESDASERYGQTSGTLTLTYEDAYGEVYTQTQEFATEILAPQVVKLSVEKPGEQTNQWQATILVLIGVIFALILAFMCWRLRRSKNALADLLAVQRERNMQ